MGHNMLFVELVLLAAGLAHAATFPPPLDLPRPPPPARPVQDPQHAPAHLLKAFGLSQPGVRGWHAEPPQYMLDLYHRLADASGLTRGPGPYGATVIRAFTEREGSVASTFLFSVAGLEEGEEVLEAEFHFYHSRLPKSQRRLLDDNTYLVEVEGSNVNEQRVLGRQHVAAHSAGWRVFKLGSVVAGLQEGSNHQGHSLVAFEVRAVTAKGQVLPLSLHHGARGSRQPLLILFNKQASANYTRDANELAIGSEEEKEEEAPPRVRRSMEATSAPPLLCKRRDMHVDFGSIGWSSWIVSPKGYNAFQCTGKCRFPLGQNLNPTNHATVQSIMHHAGGYPRVAEPCCVPSAYANLSLLFYDAEENVVLKQYDKMVALQCGCH
ncbi:bone morphogenetic protein 7-like isoform X2 [Penaeus japonicus]|uniref:bone morphogenetic protein 7-like isoform X2 n=1 Tax=Penaeus japonicus TaxID=27405 RepID=UPI001C70E6A5|nr:bone morphogenetic protein 7-like isoform X2 [Penaeus japonicus]